MEGPTLVWNTTARGDDVGFYNIKFANCISDSTVSFDLTLVAYNARGNNDSALLCRGEPRGKAVALFVLELCIPPCSSPFYTLSPPCILCSA